jgi:hypothetical protein
MKRLLLVLGVIVLLFFIAMMTAPKMEGKTDETNIPQIVQPDTFEISLLFIGDIMQHKPQIDAAWDADKNDYCYEHNFQYVKDVYGIADITIANLEFTFGGKPYAGYPMFSAPDAMGVAIKNAGIDVIVTSNNHTCDRGKKGIVNTIRVLDSLEIPRTGSFLDEEDRKKHNPLLLEKNGFRIALLNYSYGTNGMPIPEPCIVNLIDTALIKQDIQHAKTFEPDEIVVFFHWGDEYARIHNKRQTILSELCFDNGARIVIGAHPHVLQPMHRYHYPDSTYGEVAVVYSLGNYISNQRTRYRDGGAMCYIKLRKVDDVVEITEMAYILTWVWTPTIAGKKRYYIIPVSKYEHDEAFFDSASRSIFNRFRDDSREHLSKHNIQVNEMIYNPQNNKWEIKK